jgi:hypothetical protein
MTNEQRQERLKDLQHYRQTLIHKQENTERKLAEVEQEIGKLEAK